MHSPLCHTAAAIESIRRVQRKNLNDISLPHSQLLLALPQRHCIYIGVFVHFSASAAIFICGGKQHAAVFAILVAVARSARSGVSPFHGRSVVNAGFCNKS